MVSADTALRFRSKSQETNYGQNGRKECDLGEIHFLVKQEEKGDLRKDARVQDMNNVVNRLMAPNNTTKGLAGPKRKLSTRTFSVTCLSEETGVSSFVAVQKLCAWCLLILLRFLFDL
jgi:hypothetical protein